MTLLSSLPFSFLLLPLLCPRGQKKKSTLVVTEKGGVCFVVEWFVFFFQNKDAYLLFHVTSTTMHNNSNTHTKSNNTSFKSAAYNFSTYVSVLVCVLSESFFFPLLSCFTFSTFFPSFFFTLLPAYSFFVCAFCISFLFFFLNNISERLYTFQFFFFASALLSVVSFLFFFLLLCFSSFTPLC